MVLYVSVVLLATLAVLPAGHAAGGPTRGPVGAELVAILCGARPSAWRSCTGSPSGSRRTVSDTECCVDRISRRPWRKLAGAAIVAAAATVPILLFPPEEELRVVLAISSRGDHRWRRLPRGTGCLDDLAMTSAIFGVVTLMVAVVVVTAKIAVTPH